MEDEIKKESCKASVMSRIEGEHICPRSKLFFRSKECAVWALWLGSIVVGALAISVTCFVVTRHQYALYEATHENFFTFIVEVLPYLWMLTFAVMAFVAVYNLRHTKRGYRYPLWQIFLSSFVLSVAGGAVLHILGFGYAVDHLLGKQMPLYVSEEKMEAHLWQNPTDGRLLGHVSKPVEPPSTLLTFTDVDGEEWLLDVSELSFEEQDLLQREDHIKLLGQVSKDNPRIFHSCGAFPWLLDRPATRADFEAARRAFETKMHSYEERAEEMVGRKDEDNFDPQREGKQSICASIAPVRRMGRPPMMSF